MEIGSTSVPLPSTLDTKMGKYMEVITRVPKEYSKVDKSYYYMISWNLSCFAMQAYPHHATVGHPKIPWNKPRKIQKVTDQNFLTIQFLWISATIYLIHLPRLELSSSFTWENAMWGVLLILSHSFMWSLSLDFLWEDSEMADGLTICIFWCRDATKFKASSPFLTLKS